MIHKSRNSKRKERKAKRNEMTSLKNDEGPFLKVGSKVKECEVFSRDPVLNLCSASGSTPLRQSKFEGFGKRLGKFHLLPSALDGSTPQPAPSFEICGSTPRGSCNDNSICGNVDGASLFGFPEFVLNSEPDGSEEVATRPLSKMMGRHGVQADKASDFVESTVSLGDRSLCHRAPHLASVTASLPSAVVGRGPGLSSCRGRRARWSGCGSALSLFGVRGESKLIVSLSFGTLARFHWKGESCSDSEGNSCRLHHGDLLVMDGRCQDEYLHCTSPGLAEKRMNITYRWIRHHTFGCPLAAGVLGSLPACAKGSSVLGPGSGDSSVPELVYLGLLVVLFCGLLIGFARLPFYRTRFGGLSLLYRQFCPLGDYCWFGRVWPCWQQSWVHMGWIGSVGQLLRFWNFCVWFPCMLAWWRLLSLSGRDACLVIKLTGAPGGKSGLKHGKTSLSPSSIFLVSSHSLKFIGGVWFGISGYEGPGILVLVLLGLKSLMLVAG